MAASAPFPPVISWMAATGSCVRALTLCVAPNETALSKLASEMSTAMTAAAPAIAAAFTAFKPIPPAPNIATKSPFLTRAVLSTAPAPVANAQPMRAALSRGMSLRMGVRRFSETIASSLKVVTAPAFIFWPPLR